MSVRPRRRTKETARRGTRGTPRRGTRGTAPAALPAGLLVLALALALLPASGHSNSPRLAPTSAHSATGARYHGSPGTSGTSGNPGTYTNPVTSGTADTFPDPTLVHAKDGYWYAYGTQNPVFQSRGEKGEHILPILRSRDMTHWRYAGDVFSAGSLPSWFPRGTRLWAPDIRYIDGRYQLYYSDAAKDSSVGVATAPTPTGPWKDSGGSVLPSGDSGCPTGDIDPAEFTGPGGNHYLYWGSYDTACVARMNSDATRVTGPVRQVLRAHRGEGSYVVRHGSWYYLFYSDAGCCQGSHSGYQVKAGRSRSPLGPFTDKDGVPLTDRTSKGTLVVTGEGNRWIGPGHNAVATDLAGADWLVYHAIPREGPDLGPVSPQLPHLSRRPMLIDRLDWRGGWPTVRAGAGPSDSPQTAPVTRPSAGGSWGEGEGRRVPRAGRVAGRHPAGRHPAGWHPAGSGPTPQGGSTPGWTKAHEADAGTYVSRRSTTYGGLVSDGRAPRDVRAEADLRIRDGSSGTAAGSVGLLAAWRSARNHVTAWLDASRHALVTEVVADGRRLARHSTPLPSTVDLADWHNVAAQIRGGHLTVTVTDARLHDPLAEAHVSVPESALHAGSVGVTSGGGGRADADNVSGTRLYAPTARARTDSGDGIGNGDRGGHGAPDPAFSDEFTGRGPLVTKTADANGPHHGWSWLRGPAPGAVLDGNGALNWPAQPGDLPQDDAHTRPSVLLRDAPSGDYTVQTKVTFSPGQAPESAGLILYAGDDRYVRLTHSALKDHHLNALFQNTVFDHEGPRPGITARADGPMYLGPPGAAPGHPTWLRLSRRLDRTDGRTDGLTTQHIRAATSTDGTHWTRGGVWVLPAKERLRLGLISLGAPAGRTGATAVFDYVRVRGRAQHPLTTPPVTPTHRSRVQLPTSTCQAAPMLPRRPHRRPLAPPLPITPGPPHPVGRPLPLLTQSWLDLTFVHWALEPAAVAPLLPAGTEPDTLEGLTYVGLIAFRMHGVGWFGLPGVPYLGSFPETNVRLYSVDSAGRRATVFRSLDAARLLPVLMGRAGFGLKYAWSRMTIGHGDGDGHGAADGDEVGDGDGRTGGAAGAVEGETVTYTSNRRWPRPRGAHSRISVRVGEVLEQPTELEHFVTARWGLHSAFLGSTLHIPNAHPRWPLYRATLRECDENLVTAAGLPQPSGEPVSVLYSPGVDVRFGRPARISVRK